jgi:peptidase S46-like protein
MKQKAILCGLVLAACGGHPGGPAAGQTPPTPQPREPAVASASAPPAAGRAAPAEDPALGFRLQYENPGGMWLPQQMTLPGHVDTFHKMGVALDARTLSDPLAAPLSAVVSLGECTASFVSPDGLIVTNHHCVQTALQINTSKKDGQNLVEDGFLAKTRADERSAGPAARVFVAQAFKDVTKEMRDGLDKIKDPIARKDAAERHLKALLAACEKDRPDLRCSVKPFFNGSLYLQTENLEIRDVRLVYAPARSVGDYGGEIDNWNWPRHTGDWAFYRAYVGKDGHAADYAADNVPFHPRSHLQVTTAGQQPGDFVMITGYPAGTSRTRTAAAIHHEIEWALPYQIAFQKERYAIAESHAADSGETGTKATVLKQFTQNALAKQEGVLAGLTGSGALMAQKDALDKKIKDWAAQPGHEAHKQAIDKLEQLGTDERRTARVDFDRRQVFEGSRLLAAALTLTHWADERTRNNELRRAGYQERDLVPARARQKQLGRSYDRTLDRATFRLALVRALQLPEPDRPWLTALLDVKRGAKLDEAQIDKTLDAWYGPQPPSASGNAGAAGASAPVGGGNAGTAGASSPVVGGNAGAVGGSSPVEGRNSGAVGASSPVEGRNSGAVGASSPVEGGKRAVQPGRSAPSIEDETLRVSLLESGTLAQLKASKDPFLRAAQRVWPLFKAEEKKADARQGELLLVAWAYVDAMKQVLGGQLAPDANASLRISYGTIRSLRPASKDPADAPFTLASQILTKDTGKEPFNAPRKLLDAIRAKHYGPYADPALGGELPIDFLNDLDITGGNSGSPILNGKGELVGLAFDTTLTGVASDVVFNPATTRGIGVDVRYLLWTLDLLDGGDHLITEMGLTPRLP